MAQSKLNHFNIRKIKLSQFQIDLLATLVKKTRTSGDGYVYPDNEKGNSGFIVQSNNVQYNDGRGNITVYYSDYIGA